MTVIRRTFEEPPICEREILRYAGCKAVDDTVHDLMHTCVEQMRYAVRYALVYARVPLFVEGDVCDFGAFSCRSQQLADNLSGCEEAVLLAATIGVETDRLIARYGRVSPSKAVMMQAFGAERIEALCDTFCQTFSEEQGIYLRPRFSPGYGDLSLEVQRDLVAVLDAPKQIGLTLNDSLLLSPAKSVTAFIGISQNASVNPRSKCVLCQKYDCAFRGVT